MDILTKDDLQLFLKPYEKECVSIFMPAHRAGRETQQDPIRLKNLLTQAENELIERGMRLPDAQELLTPAQALFSDEDFWQHQSDGLAIFLGQDIFQYYRLPLSFDELVMVSRHFHFKPLLPIFAQEGHFYLMALSENEVRLLEGTKYTIAEVELDKSLPELAQVLRFDEFNNQLQYHTGSVAPVQGERAAMYHGHDPKDDEESHLLRWFHKIDQVLQKEFAHKESPLVIAGVDHLLPLYQQANTHPHLLDEGISGNPEQLSAKELHQKAWQLVEPSFSKEQKMARESYFRLKITSQASDDIRQIILAAALGKVSHLFVAIGEQVPGSVDIDALRVEVAEEPSEGSDDLLNLAALQTLDKGGKVFAVPREEVPDQAVCAAVYRY